MKFAFATAFVLALAMGVQSSIIPWGHSHLTEVAGHGLSYTAVSSPVHHGHVLAHAHLPAAVAIHESPIVHHGLIGLHHDAHLGLHHDAHLGLHHGAHLGLHHDLHNAGHHAAVIVDSHHLHAPLAHIAHEGHYVAKTRGAIHEAPLPGHIASAASINVAPAPGTH